MEDDAVEVVKKCILSQQPPWLASMIGENYTSGCLGEQEGDTFKEVY